MFMRFLGGGIGHKVTDHVEQITPTRVRDEAPDLHNEDTIPQNMQDHTREDDDDVVGDPEEVDADEEADYGYADDVESEDEDLGEDSESKGENSKSEEESNADDV